MMIGSAPRHRSIIDAAMLMLAVVSVGLLSYIAFFDVSPETVITLAVVDSMICGVFAVEFLARWRSAGWDRRFPLRGWYEIIGMIPIAHPALRSFRLLRIVVVAGRLARTADRAFGERITQRLVERYSRPIVLAIKKPITIAVLDEVVKVVETGNYPQNIARTLGQNRQLLREIVTEKLRNDPQTGKLARLPFHDEIAKSVMDTTIRIVLDVLTDPRIDEFFAHLVRENQLQIRAAVQQGLHEQDNEDDEDNRNTPGAVLSRTGPAVSGPSGHEASARQPRSRHPGA